ncbi:Dabb family protein [Paenibacillus ehimensis]|uniref:Dabb family protein n=1 Tax=Paenibacillus ehimensis TaxID=79264 RepID=UPI002CFAF3B2|nr:Dabb family protein [Paenibacillus ehimensis]MEC0208621.1 Dabb family protein [Paenibacillus ehimensis]HWO95577.1 Dabb family protein [Bacillus sp. (in: firmicutes)]
MVDERILHIVLFRLKHDIASEKTRKLIEDAKAILTTIPTVEKFEVLKQINSRTPYDFGLSMEFRNQAAYDEYLYHPEHTNFVKNRWENEVIDFLEVDLKTCIDLDFNLIKKESAY